MKNANKPIPFWSWNDKLEKEELIRQIEWMHKNGIGGFFMHARGGLKTEYLSNEWFDCIRACCQRAEELGMDAWAYDENGWPSGFVGGKLLSDANNLARYLTSNIGAYDEKAYISYSLDGDKLEIVDCGENCLNIYLHISISNTDILNPDVVDKFIAETHEKYKKEVLDRGYKLKGFFTDEPQYYREATPYSPMIEKYFIENYGEEAKPNLGLLFVEKEGYREFRYRYYLGMNTLLTQNYARKIYEWCDKNGLLLTGHYIEERGLVEQMMCAAGCSPLYEYEHIPGIDWLKRGVLDEVAPKQVSSVAAQMGRKYVLTETFAACGWSVTPRELKRIAEYQFVHGVNLVCGHLTPYSEYGQRKRDYPAHYSEMNPWCKKYFKEFNDYLSEIGHKLSESQEVIRVGVLHPMRSMYFVYKRNDHRDTVELNTAFSQDVEMLADRQIGHHYLDETLLEKYGVVTADAKLKLGCCEYDYLILPLMYTMGKSTENLLRQYVSAGGKILLLRGKPEYLEGKKYEYSYLESNTTIEEIVEKQLYSITYKGGKLRTSTRKDKNGNPFVYAVNLSEQEAAILSIGNGHLKIEPYGSAFVDPSKLPTSLPEEQKKLPLGDIFKVVGGDENKFTIDRARYSFDGKNYGEEYSVRQIFKKLLDERYEGELYLQYSFVSKTIPKKISLLAENMNTKTVWINGVPIRKQKHFEAEKELYIYDLIDQVKIGDNQIVIQGWYHQSPAVYHALYGENVTESLRNCLVYDTNIESIYLQGDFGVYGCFKKSSSENVLIGKDFYLAERKLEIRDLIRDGYPFFSGEIVLQREMTLEDNNYTLEVNGAFHGISVNVNGRAAGHLFFNNKLDLSQYLSCGENTIVYGISVSNRNLLGPHHMAEDVDDIITPRTFDEEGVVLTAEKEKRLKCYKFIKNII